MSRAPLEYTIVYGYIIEESSLQRDNIWRRPLSIQVNEMMQKGWRPQGGIALMSDVGRHHGYTHDYDLAMQAMIRDPNDPWVTHDLTTYTD